MGRGVHLTLVTDWLTFLGLKLYSFVFFDMPIQDLKIKIIRC